MDEDDLFEIAIGLLGLGERPWVQAVRVARPARPVRDLPGDDPPRPLTTPTTASGSAGSCSRRSPVRSWTTRCSSRSRCWSASTTWCAAPPASPTATTSRRSRSGSCTATRAWTDDLRAALIAEHGEQRGPAAVPPLPGRVPARLPLGRPTPPTAVEDIARLERIGASDEGAMISLYRPRAGWRRALRCKLYSSAGVSLSDVLPTFEHMGAKVVDERPYRVQPDGAEPVWIYDFGLRLPGRGHGGGRRDSSRRRSSTRAGAGSRTTGSTRSCWRRRYRGGRSRSSGRSRKYLRQAGIAYSDAYMERTLLRPPGHRAAAREAVPRAADPDGPDPELAERLGRAMEVAIDGVPSLDEDRILRNFLAVVRATVRTSYFRGRTPSAPAAYLSFKLEPATVPRCRSRGRSSRSSSTRRGSRASTCGAARWPAAGSAGPTGRRTSAPRCSG